MVTLRMAGLVSWLVVLSVFAGCTGTRSAGPENADVARAALLLEQARGLEEGSLDAQEQALEHYLEALPVVRKEYQPDEAADVLSHIATLYASLSRSFTDDSLSQVPSICSEEECIEAALAFAGEAATLVDPEWIEQTTSLQENSPLLQPSMSVAAEAVYVREGQQLLEALLGAADIASRFSSAEEVMEALDAANANRYSSMKLDSNPVGLRVDLREWRHRNREHAWMSVSTDTTLEVKAVTFQLRYTPPGTNTSKIIKVPCVNGCNVKLPRD